MAPYALEPVEALDTMAVDAVRRIYEEGFPDRLRADFASLTDQREEGEAALALVRGPQPYGFAMLRRLGGTGWTYLRYFVVEQRRLRHLLRPPVQRLQPGLLRHGLL